jgi:hypothetical protein
MNRTEPVRRSTSRRDLPPRPDARDGRLSSWKEIASYLGRGVRTVQRWHSQLLLPVHRVKGRTPSPVFAFKLELDYWMQQCAQRDERLLPDGEPQRRKQSAALNTTVDSMSKMSILVDRQYDRVARIAREVRRMVRLQKTRRSQRS